MNKPMAVQTEGRNIARPLKVLVPLIKEDFETGDRVGMPYFIAAGKKLIEAQEGHFDGDTKGFFGWSEKTFGKSSTQIRTYIAAARATNVNPLKEYKNLDHFKREGLGQNRPIGRSRGREYTPQVDAVAERARNEARRLALEDSLTRTQERDADRKLALRLIDIGFKVLARELHPDKGGSRDAMARLNRVRDRLKECI